MLKFVAQEIWAFDAEWVPDPETGRRVYGLQPDMPEEDVLQKMWEAGGATEEDPYPYLKTVLCRVVSVSAVIRRRHKDGSAHVQLHSVPTHAEEPISERELLERFLNGIGKAKPQLVGFNSISADLPILIQRAMVNGVSAPDFSSRPNKSWEGVDYFTRYSDYHVDLKEHISGWGKGTPSLHEVATACGIPGKMDTTGQDVAALWRAGNFATILEYNDFDALTTYLVWLRLAHLAGLVSGEDHAKEQEQLRVYLDAQAKSEKPHLKLYLDAWDGLAGRTVEQP